MNRPRAFSPRLDRAIAIAALAHWSQARKSTDVPYVSHPFHVALLLDRHGWPEDLVIAGLLHDVLEDTDFPEESLRREFGDGPIDLVRAVTERKTEGGAKRPWHVRKAEGHDHLRAASRDVAALKAADALHNAGTVIADLRTGGLRVMERFNASPAESLWNYETVSRIVLEKLGAESAIARELAGAVAELRFALSRLGGLPEA